MINYENRYGYLVDVNHPVYTDLPSYKIYKGLLQLVYHYGYNLPEENQLRECGESELLDRLYHIVEWSEYCEPNIIKLIKLAYKTFTQAFKVDTGIILYINYHNSDNEGNPEKDEVNGAFWLGDGLSRYKNLSYDEGVKRVKWQVEV